MDVGRAAHRLAAAGRRLHVHCVRFQQARTLLQSHWLTCGRRRWLCPHSSPISRHTQSDTSHSLASVAPVFSVMKFDKEGNILSFERKKTELYQELGLQARDLRFQHLVSISSRNNKIILRMEFVKAVITSEYLLILDYRNLHLEQWFLRELAPQLAGEGQLVTYSLPFEFRALEAILQHRAKFSNTEKCHFMW
ncbi:unnamed protein product [Ranitomeya imitator]|uniref:Magnesium transporter MRS2 homolog, mitochondrial n=1 Tax=Ranitomeya imitator TaxID=111125 RepID=A0ABN9MDG9_9NEOB|nr:unnamed protein product [Ranitomeya imitator]